MSFISYETKDGNIYFKSVSTSTKWVKTKDLATLLNFTASSHAHLQPLSLNGSAHFHTILLPDSGLLGKDLAQSKGQ